MCVCSSKSYVTTQVTPLLAHDCVAVALESSRISIYAAVLLEKYRNKGCYNIHVISISGSHKEIAPTGIRDNIPTHFRYEDRLSQ